MTKLHNLLKSRKMDYPEDLFVNEDISKPENRINLAIFHLQMIKDFHEWMMERLNLDFDTLLYPIINTEGVRPDFVLRYQNQIKGYIEVECATNPIQLNNFKNKFENNQVKVYSIFGKKEYTADLSLEEIKEYIDNEMSYESLNYQQLLSISYLSKLIDKTTNSIYDRSRKPVSQIFIDNNPFIRDLLDKLNDKIMIENITKPSPGHIYYDTQSTNGFSLQVYSTKTKEHHTTLLSITKGQNISFRSAQHYRTYLDSNRSKIIEEFIDFICNDLNLNINSLTFKSSLEINTELVHKKLDRLIILVKKLT